MIRVLFLQDANQKKKNQFKGAERQSELNYIQKGNNNTYTTHITSMNIIVYI